MNLALTQRREPSLSNLIGLLVISGLLIVASCGGSSSDYMEGMEDNRSDNPTRLHEGQRGRTLAELTGEEDD